MTPAPAHSERASGTHYLPGLDGLRGIACLLVFIYHLRWEAHEPPLHLLGIDCMSLLRRCDTGVAIFFVLSGLLLSQPFWRAILENRAWPPFAPYLWRRACRIVPAYYACLAVIFLLNRDTYTFYGFLDFLLHVSFLHPFVEYSYASMNGVLWSIGIEAQFYVMLPAIMLGVAWLWRKAGAPAACVSLIAGTLAIDLVTRAGLSALAPHLPERFLLPHDGHVIPGTIFSYLKFFAAGILAGLLLLRWPRWAMGRIPTFVCLAALVLGALLLAIGDEGHWRQTVTSGWPLNVIAFGLLAAATPHSRTFSRGLSVGWLQAAGTLSYGIYLWHELVQKAVFGGTLPGLLPGLSLFFIGGTLALGVTVLLAWLSYRFLEQPAIQASYPFVSRV